jgi:hypothetical protein
MGYLYRTTARWVRSRPAVWRAVHPLHDIAMRQLKDLRARFDYAGQMDWSEERGNELVKQAVGSGEPHAIGKIGSLESEAVLQYLSRTLTGGTYSTALQEQLFVNVGLFPPNPALYDAFCETYIGALSSVDILAAWGAFGEARLIRRYCADASLIRYHSLEPYRFEDPWSSSLEGKNVLVIHPFVDSIEEQYRAHREQIWGGRRVLPEFRLTTLRMPLSRALESSPFASWFDLLDSLSTQIAKLKFDVALIGAGGMSLPLAARIKSLGRTAIHTGGATQMIFGIRGRRWEGYNHRRLQPFFNEYWTRPKPHETPQSFERIELGAYW